RDHAGAAPPHGGGGPGLGGASPPARVSPMAEPAPAYRREFLLSPHHAWLGLLTLGAGFIAAQPLALVGGATAYALGWIYLLGIEESLERYLETERREELPRVVKEAEDETKSLGTEVEALKTKGASPVLDSKQRLLGSVQERLEVLHKRQQRVEQANQNLALVDAEQERLVEQIKLIRADAVATKNAEVLTARIDATVEHLDQTNKWLSELDEFKDMVGDMPATELRVGFEPTAATPVARPPRRDRLGIGAKEG